MYRLSLGNLSKMRIPLQHATRYGIRLYSRIPLVNRTLQQRVAEALHRNAQIIPVLEHWRQQGNKVDPSHLRAIIKELRDSKNPHQALQVSEWMSEEKMSNLVSEDFAARLHLIDMTSGLEKAEKFFESIPTSLRDDSVYTTLLNSYARSEKTLDKAEATFQKMRELGLVSRPSPYNAMMSLYCALKDRDKVEALLGDMKDKDVKPDSVTMNNVMKLYSALSDVTAMEKFWNEWRDEIPFEWLATVEMAKCYLRTGSREKGVEMLRLTGKLVDKKSLKSAYEILMKLYGEAGEKEEVLHIWGLYENNIKERDNEGYRSVIGSLLKLNDIDKAEKICREWERLPFEFDIRIPTMLASSYRERGMIDKAEELMTNKTIMDRRMNEPVAPILEQWGNDMKPFDRKCLIKILRDSNQLSKALQVSEWMHGKRNFNIYSEDYSARLHLIEYVLGLEQAEKFFESIPENMKDSSVYSTLLSSYAKSEKTLDKANATFEKMRELGFLLKPSPFNSMLSFCDTNIMVEEILREMEENNVEPDSLTVNKVLKAYAAKSKVEAMETYMSMWSGEEGIKLERDTFLAMAKAYYDSGLLKKAMEMYSNVGSKGYVYYVWNEYKKKASEVEDDGYRSVISSLLKLDDVQGAENIYREWIPHGPTLNLSIPGLLISRFCAEGNHIKVKELVKSLGNKRNMMHLMMVKRFVYKVVKGVGLVVGIIILTLFYGISKNPFLFAIILSR